MRAPALRKLPKAELEARLRSERQRLEELRGKLVQKQLKNVREIRTARKEIARVLTILRESQ